MARRKKQIQEGEKLYIKTFKTASLEKFNKGEYEWCGKKAVVDDSLFLRFLVNSNLDCDLTGKDLICIKFNGGYEREDFYRDGVNYEGEHYQLLYRSSAKAKEGKVIFISDRLYEMSKDFLEMGIKTDKVVELEAYKALICSSIVGTIHIEPKNILIVADKESSITKEVESIESQNGTCIVTTRKQKLTNVIWDGQSLIDESLFTQFKDGNGMILLRNHFFKSCAFRCDIQQYIKDNNLKGKEIRDIFGLPHKAEDIKLICTESSCKWLKFGNTIKDYEHWCSVVEKYGNEFGIVKTDHPSKWGNKQRLSYQMINSLPATKEDIEELCKDTVDYINQMKADNEDYLNFLSITANSFNANQMLIDMVNRNCNIENTKWFKAIKSNKISEFKKKLKNGKLLVSGDNFTVLSNPMEMLDFAFKGEYKSYFKTEENAIQCSTNRFTYNTYLCAFRSPHNSPNNVLYLHNVDLGKQYNKYFYGLDKKNVIVINSICTDVQDRANSLDYDSDFFLVSNNITLIRLAKKCYEEYKTIVNNIGKNQVKYSNTPEDKAKIDKNFAILQRIVGESTNLAQIALSNYWSEKNKDKRKVYYDSFVILSVLAQVAIDSVKREFDVELIPSLKKIRDDMAVEKVPKFFKEIQKLQNKKKNIKTNKEVDYAIKCPMNYVFDVLDEKIGSITGGHGTDIAEYLYDYESSGADYRQRDKIIKLSEEASKLAIQINNKDELAEAQWNELIKELSTKKINKDTYGLLFRMCFNGDKKVKNSMVLLNILYQKSKTKFLDNIKEFKEESI